MRQVAERRVGLVEPIGGRGHLDADAGRGGQELAAVVAGVGRDTAQHPLLEQVLGVAERRDVAEVDAGDRQRAATIEGAERRRDERAYRGEQDGGVERFGRRVGLGPHAGGAQVERQLPGLGRPGEDVDPGPLGHRHLGRQVGRAAEAVDPEPPARGTSGLPQRPVADDPRAQERGRHVVGERVGERVGVALVDDQVLGVAAVEVPAREQRIDAQVLAAGAAEGADPARAGQPGHPDAIADAEPGGAVTRDVDGPHRLVARHHLGVLRRQVPLGQVEVGAADAAHADLHPHLPRSGRGHRPLDEPQGAAVDGTGVVDHPGPHRRGRHGAEPCHDETTIASTIASPRARMACA